MTAESAKNVEPLKGQRPWIVAHRGVSSRYPENSKAAFAAAVACGADAIECDLQLTADHQIVVCHDTNLERYGHPNVEVAKSTLQQLQALDTGSWFAPKFQQQRLLSLDDLLREFGHQIPLFLEIKDAEISPEESTTFLKHLANTITSHQLQNQVSLLCFNPESLRQMSDLAPWARLLLNTHKPDQIDDNVLLSQPWLHGVDANLKHLSDRVVRLIHQQTLLSLCFTCDNEDDVIKAIDLHVDGLISNDPDQAIKIASERRRSCHAT